jgi:hypothetical protein
MYFLWTGNDDYFLNDSICNAFCIPVMQGIGYPVIYLFTFKIFNMVKRKSDEPENKALQRLQQFEESRKAVPEIKPGDDKKKKENKKDPEKKDENGYKNKATDELEC